MVKILKIVKKFGNSWVVCLTKDDRELLGVRKEGDRVALTSYIKDFLDENNNTEVISEWEPPVFIPKEEQEKEETGLGISHSS